MNEKEREFLYKQLELLAEKSKEADAYELSKLSLAMAKIGITLNAIPFHHA